MNNGSGFGGTIGRLFIVAVLLVGGYFLVTNVGIEKIMNRGSELVASGADAVVDMLDGSTGSSDGSEKVEGDRPYQDTNKESMSVLADNIAEYSNERGYERDDFGSGWNSVSNENSVGWERFPEDSCDVRRAVLIEYGDNVEYNDDCDITSGTWTGSYGERDGSGEVVYHTSDVSKDFDIDHIVALSLAYRSGAVHLDEDIKNQIANDKANLVVSEAGINRSKGDQNIVDWTPPTDSTGYCDYADRYAHVKAKYDLTVLQEEYDKLEGILESCNA